MKRSGFKRPQIERKRPVAEPIPMRLRRNAVFARCDVPDAPPVEKDAPVRHEGYRRLVASMPCRYCGIAGYSQAAHANTGKGAGIKSDDRTCFPLCADRPGQRGCHSRFDQGALFEKSARRAVELQWASETRGRIERSGLWPKNLPKWSEK